MTTDQPFSAATTPAEPLLSVVVPVLDAREHLACSLPPLLAAVPGTIVVDDGSRDGSRELARDAGARVLDTGARGRGPAFARNLGARHAHGDVLVFVDADVVVHPDALQRIAAAFREPSLGAIYGSYDATPSHRDFASLYMNLRHHHGHRVPCDDADTFWAGLGAVRRDAFAAAGGFDAERYAFPSVEDIDLGRRLREAGFRIRRDPTILGTHRKRWTWRLVVHTDVVRRAAPWAELMRRHPGAFTDLNVARREQLRAVLAAAALASVPLALAGLAPPWLAAALLAGALLANLGLARLFWRRGGPWFAVLGTLFHQLHLAYAALAFAWCRLRGGARPPHAASDLRTSNRV